MLEKALCCLPPAGCWLLDAPLPPGALRFKEGPGGIRGSPPILLSGIRARQDTYIVERGRGLFDRHPNPLKAVSA